MAKEEQIKSPWTETERISGSRTREFCGSCDYENRGKDFSGECLEMDPWSQRARVSSGLCFNKRTDGEYAVKVRRATYNIGQRTSE